MRSSPLPAGCWQVTAISWLIGTVVGLWPPTPTAAMSNPPPTSPRARPSPASQASGSARPGGQESAPSKRWRVQALTWPPRSTATARTPLLPKSTPTTTVVAMAPVRTVSGTASADPAGPASVSRGGRRTASAD